LKIWIVTVGEPLPLDDDRQRLHRSSMIADKLYNRGHEILWWSSTFDHINKKMRFDQDTEVAYNERFLFRLLYGRPYERNISFDRIRNHQEIARVFRDWSKSSDRPDLILTSMPTIELTKEAVQYANDRFIPVVVDLRDMWPDIFLEAFPKPLRIFGKILLYKMNSNLKSACKNATGLTGITPEFVDWGLAKAGRSRRSGDRHFWLGYNSKLPIADRIEAGRKMWSGLGLNKNLKIICFFGTFSNKLILEPFFEAISKLEAVRSDLRLVLCGEGDDKENLIEKASISKNIIFPGWVGAGEIQALLEISSIGLAPYRDRFDFLASIPTKAIEYMSAGLPILSTLNRFNSEISLERNKIGFHVDPIPDQIAGSIDAFFNQDSLKEVMIANSKAVYVKKFSEDIVYGGMADYLEEFVEKKISNLEEDEVT